jgi:hypothetical protein
VTVRASETSGVLGCLYCKLPSALVRGASLQLSSCLRCSLLLTVTRAKRAAPVERGFKGFVSEASSFPLPRGAARCSQVKIPGAWGAIPGVSSELVELCASQKSKEPSPYILVSCPPNRQSLRREALSPSVIALLGANPLATGSPRQSRCLHEGCNRVRLT